MSTPDVAVVGGGVIGLGIAWRCARRGLRVTVVDPHPGSGASGVAAGMLAPVTEAHFGEESLLRLALASAERWPAFAAELAAETGTDIGYRTEGTLLVAHTEDDLREIARLHRFHQSLGLPAEALSARECRTRVPLLAPRIRGGMYAAHDHQVDPRRLTTALASAAERSGVRYDRRRVSRLADLDADRVVLAAGSWSARLADLPVRPVKGQVLRLRAPEAPFGVNVRALTAGRSVYLVPRTDGEVVVGATMEDRGEDVTVTAGGVYELLRAAVEVLPEVAEYQLAETVAGLRPGTPDNAPLLGATADPRVVAATGHYRNGILLAPVTADLIAELLVTGEAPEELAAFSPLRFSRRDASATAAHGDPAPQAPATAHGDPATQTPATADGGPARQATAPDIDGGGQ